MMTYLHVLLHTLKVKSDSLFVKVSTRQFSSTNVERTDLYRTTSSPDPSTRGIWFPQVGSGKYTFLGPWKYWARKPVAILRPPVPEMD
jgi:hypothetical protein